MAAAKRRPLSAGELVVTATMLDAGRCQRDIAAALGWPQTTFRTALSIQAPKLYERSGRRLTQPQRQQIAARRQQGASYSAIARDLGFNKGTVWKSLDKTPLQGRSERGEQHRAPRQAAPTGETRFCSGGCGKPIPRERGIIWCVPCRRMIQARDNHYAF